MNKTMFAAIISAGVLLFGVIATAYEIVPDAQAMKSKGNYHKDSSSAKKLKRSTKICGDQLCGDIKDSSTQLRKGQVSRTG